MKFAWSGPAALRLAREIGVLTALRAAGGPVPARGRRQQHGPPAPDHQARAGHLPVRGRRLDRPGPGRQAARLFPGGPAPSGGARACRGRLGKLPARSPPPRPSPCATGSGRGPGRISAGGPALVRLGRRRAGLPAPAVLVHGDLHGDNQVWDGDELRLVVDFETIGAAEPEYDLRTFPGPGTGPGRRAADRHHAPLPADHRAPAVPRPGDGRHLRTALGDALWRSEAGIPLADHRTPPQWVDDLAVRFSALGIRPVASPSS